MNHHFVLILANVLDRITLTGVAIKGQNHELLWEIHIPICPQRKESRMHWGSGSESAVMWHPHLFDSLLYKLVEILNADELLSLPSRMIMYILRAGMRGT